MQRTLIAALAAALVAAAPAVALERIYLVRHAEKEEPWPAAYADFQPLSEAGRVRALRLAERFADAGLVAVYSSLTSRAFATAMPIAQRAGVRVVADDATIDRRALPAFFDALRERHRDGRAVLVVGHSNTIPWLLEALGGGDCRRRLGVGDDDLIKGYDGLWRIDLHRPGCAGIERLSQGPAD